MRVLDRCAVCGDELRETTASVRIYCGGTCSRRASRLRARGLPVNTPRRLSKAARARLAALVPL
jgi:hypothetical protein